MIYILKPAFYARAVLICLYERNVYQRWGFISKTENFEVSVAK